MEKLKEIAKKDIFVTSLVIYCSGWVLMILYIIVGSFFTKGGEYQSRLPGKMIDNPTSLIWDIAENLALFSIVIFPLIALIALVNIKMSIIFLAWLGVFKNHASSNSICSLDV